MIWRWLKGALPFAATLAVGIAIGMMHQRPGSAQNTPRHDVAMASSTGFDNQDIMQAVADAVHPDSAQRLAIHEILVKRQGEIDSAWQMVRPNVIAVMEGTHRDILAVLRPEQRAQFLRFVTHGAGLPDSLQLQDPQAAAGWLQRLHQHLWEFFRGMHGRPDSAAAAAH